MESYFAGAGAGLSLSLSLSAGLVAFLLVVCFLPLSSAALVSAGAAAPLSPAGAALSSAGFAAGALSPPWANAAAGRTVAVASARTRMRFFMGVGASL